jgi:hypothetical protein
MSMTSDIREVQATSVRAICMKKSIIALWAKGSFSCYILTASLWPTGQTIAFAKEYRSFLVAEEMRYLMSAE